MTSEVIARVTQGFYSAAMSELSIQAVLETKIVTLRDVKHVPRGTVGTRKLVERAKLVLSSNLSRRWTLADVAAEVGVSPVYLTQLFKQIEGIPLYRYQLRLRLARALDLFERGRAADDISALSMDLGFSSHSHFTATFRRAYGRTPVDFLRSIRRR